MRFRIITTICLSLCLSNIRANDSITDINRAKVDYYFLYSQYNNVFSETPSLLTNWQYKDWSYIGVDYDLANGNFRNPQKYNNHNQVNIKTESVYNPTSSDWIFYGKFRYSNGKADSVNTNLSYNIERDGSPFYIFQLNPGNWSLQNYEFNVTAAKKVSNRFSYGLKLLYDGDLSFKINDTRNNQISFITDLILSGTYDFQNGNLISIGLGYNRVKTEPTLSNKFLHSDAELYIRYLNTGLGSYIKNIDYNVTIHNNTFGSIVQWVKETNNSTYSAIYEFFSGEETYINKRLTNINDQKEILNYKHITHKARISTLNNISGKFLSTCLNFRLLSGEGGQWSTSSSTYLKNYSVDILEADFRMTLYNPSSFLRRVNLETRLEDVSKLDKNYGYQFSYSNMRVGLNTELLLRQKSIRTGLMIGLLYGKNLDNLNFPNAALGNIYTTFTSNPLMSFLACDYIEVPAYLRFDIPVKNNLIEVLLSGKHQYPIQMNYNVDSLFDTNDSFRFYNISLKFYF